MYWNNCRKTKQIPDIYFVLFYSIDFYYLKFVVPFLIYPPVTLGISVECLERRELDYDGLEDGLFVDSMILKKG